MSEAAHEHDHQHSEAPVGEHNHAHDHDNCCDHKEACNGNKGDCQTHDHEHAHQENKESGCDYFAVVNTSVTTVGTGVSAVGTGVIDVSTVGAGYVTTGVDASINVVSSGVSVSVDVVGSWVKGIAGVFSPANRLPTRPIGSQGLVVSVQGLGCMGMTAFYHDSNPADLEESNQATIAKALELGINFFDTAWIYQSFGKGGFPNQTNEELLGRAIAKHGRDKFIIATKCGILPSAEGPKADSTEAVIRSQLQDSLTRLGVDCIDLYYQHRPDANTPMEDVMKVFKALIEEGKIKYIGLSECTADELRRAHAVHPITAIQMEWSLQTHDIETNGILETARELGVGIVAYSPLGRGFLTAKLVDINQLDENDWRRTNPRFAEENFAKNAQLESFKAIAEKKGCTAGQLALAWLYAQGEDVFPIPGTKSAERVEENVGAFFVKLTKEEAEEVCNVVAPGQGSRYAHSYKK